MKTSMLTVILCLLMFLIAILQFFQGRILLRLTSSVLSATEKVNKIEAEMLPSSWDLPKSHETIHHPTYGDYPETVQFQQGMTLMPGQSATGEIMIEIPEELR